MLITINILYIPKVQECHSKGSKNMPYVCKISTSSNQRDICYASRNNAFVSCALCSPFSRNGLLSCNGIRGSHPCQMLRSYGTALAALLFFVLS